jgi:hypothetical protein
MVGYGKIVAIFVFVVACALGAAAAETGSLKLDVMGELGAGAANAARVIDGGGMEAGQVRPGSSIELKPGDYRIELPIVGGTIRRESVHVSQGRTTTVTITNVAVLEVSVRDRTGKDPGFAVTVSSSDPPHRKVASFVSGEKYLFAPMQVNVHVDAPPQGYDWTAIGLVPGQRARLNLGEVVPAGLEIQTTLHGKSIDEATRVLVMRAGTQSRVAESAPGPHRFKLDPGDYDVYVENGSGKGRATASVSGIHLEGAAAVEKTIPMD